MNLVQGPQDFRAGVRAVGTGLRLLFQPGLRRFVVVPLALNTLLFAAVVWVLVRWLKPWVDQLSERFGGFLGAAAWILFAALTLFLVVQVFVVVGTWVGSPFYGFLAQAVERRRKGAVAEGRITLREILAEASFALVQECRKACYFLLLILPVLVLGLVPVLQLAAPVLWILVGSWILAVESFDFPLSHRRMPLPDQRRLLRRRPGLAWGLGLATFGLGLVPLLQLVAIPASVVGATLLWVDELESVDRGPTAPDAGRIGPGRASEEDRPRRSP